MKGNIACVIVMLLVLADGSMFPPHVILYHIRMSTEQLHRVPVVRCEHKGWVEGLVGVEQRARGCNSGTCIIRN